MDALAQKEGTPSHRVVQDAKDFLPTYLGLFGKCSDDLLLIDFLCHNCPAGPA